MKRIKVIKMTIFIASILILSSSCEKDEVALLKGEVELTFPSNWQVTENYSDLVLLMGISPREGANDEFLENVNVAREDAKGYTLQNYYEANLNAMKTFSNYQLVSTVDTTINGFDSKKIIFTATFNSMDLKFMDFLFHEENYGFVITCSAMENTFDDYSATFESIVSTFSIK